MLPRCCAGSEVGREILRVTFGSTGVPADRMLDEGPPFTAFPAAAVPLLLDARPCVADRKEELIDWNALVAPAPTDSEPGEPTELASWACTSATALEGVTPLCRCVHSW
jgi:hypothetical protein